MACLDKDVACHSAISHERDARGSCVRFAFARRFATKLVHAPVLVMRLIAGSRFGSAGTAYGSDAIWRRCAWAADRDFPDCSGGGLLTHDTVPEERSDNALPAPATPYGRCRAALCERKASGGGLSPFGGGDIAGAAPVDRPVHGGVEFLHAALENTDQGILMLCPNKRVRLQNRRARELLGLSPDELRDGEPFDEMRWLQFQQRGSGPPIARLRRRIERRGSERHNLRRCAAEPDHVFLEVRSVSLDDGGAVKTVTDVTEQWLAVLAVQESEQRYRLLAENMTDVLILPDLEGAYRYVSPATRAVFGCEPEELLGEHPLTRIHPEEAASCERVLDDLRNLRVDQCVTCWRYWRFDGAWMWLEVSFNVVRDNSGGASGWVAVLRDISSRRATEEALRLSEQRLALALDSGNDGLWDWCVRSGRVAFSQHWFGMLGYAEGELEPHIRTWERLIHPEDTKGALRCLTQHVARQTAHFECEYRLRTKGRGYLWTLARGTVVEHDANGRPLRMVGTHIDLTRRKEIEQQVAHIAAHDALTNLPNRALFRDRLSCELANAERHGGSVAVLACDLDRFKAVNDTLGHPAGHALLRTIADRLHAIVRDGETVARLGGDEFEIILPRSIDPQAASLAAQRVIEAVGQPVDLDGTVASVGASIGLALGPQDGTDADTLFKNADIALYRAKGAGRNTYSFYEPGMGAVVATRIRLERDLGEAARCGEFVLLYQPILNLASGEVGGFEALLRWQHPTRGTVSPAEFIPVAEETGLIVDLGAWALQEACRQAAGWPNALRVAVNVSAVQFQRPGLEEAVVGALAASGLAAQRLELEITESVLMQDVEVAVARLHRLRALGVRTALDDFGTGYSPLSYLRRFPFDRIKIDRSFIKEIAGPDTATIVRAIVSIGGQLGTSVTAEGVETEEQLVRVRQEGCTKVQGFLYGQPLLKASAWNFIQSHTPFAGQAASMFCTAA